MAYHNRKALLSLTLRSIDASHFRDFEVIIVDDGSDSEHRIEDLVSMCNFSIRLIRIEPHQKTWSNPCVPYNIGFDAVQADVVVIQNPECLHVGDILSDVAVSSTESNYVSYACYAVSQITTGQLVSINSIDPNVIKNTVGTFNMVGPPDVDPATWMAWFNHPIVRPIGYHWCCAISNANLNLLGGFDERYADGIGWDDPEFVRRVRRLGLNVDFPDETRPLVIHMHHPHRYDLEWAPKFSKNELLFNSTAGEQEYKAVRRNSC
jgi:hypothetical protein